MSSRNHNLMILRRRLARRRAEAQAFTDRVRDRACDINDPLRSATHDTPRDGLRRVRPSRHLSEQAGAGSAPRLLDVSAEREDGVSGAADSGNAAPTDVSGSGAGGRSFYAEHVDEINAILDKF